MLNGVEYLPVRTHASRLKPRAFPTLDFCTGFEYQSDSRPVTEGEFLMAQANTPFNLVEATIDDIHEAYKFSRLTCRQLVQMYLDRIEAFDQKGPKINAMISLNAGAL